MPTITSIDNATSILLQEAVCFFHLGVPLSMEPMIEGLGNRNFLVTTNSGQFVIKEGLFHPLEDIKLELVYLDRLLAHNFPVPSYFQGMNGEKIFRKSDRIFWAQKKVGGEHPEKTPAVCAVLGKWLAKLHTIPCDGLPPRNHWMTPTFITRLMKSLQNSHLPYKAQALASYERLGMLDFISMPQAIIHNDIYRGNLLFDGLTLVAIIDWEETVTGAAILDVASAIVNFCLHEGRIIERNFRVLLNGYSAERDFQKEELINLRNAVQYVSFTNSIWLMVQFGIKTPDEYQLGRGEKYWRFNLDNLVLPQL
jgi:homoserine kinase type II